MNRIIRLSTKGKREWYGGGEVVMIQNSKFLDSKSYFLPLEGTSLGIFPAMVHDQPAETSQGRGVRSHHSCTG